jgi:NADPH:quinone reductase-like Zn-dependent oxidoreductase
VALKRVCTLVSKWYTPAGLVSHPSYQMIVFFLKPPLSAFVDVQAGLGKPVTTFPTLKITSKELSVIGSVRYTGNCFQTAIDMMARGAVNLKPLITKTYPLAKCQEAFEAVRAGVEIKIIVMNQE